MLLYVPFVLLTWDFSGVRAASSTSPVNQEAVHRSGLSLRIVSYALLVQRRCLRRLCATFLVGAVRACAENDAHSMARAVVREWNVVRGQRLAGQLDECYAAAHAVGVFDLDLIARCAVAIVDLVVAPARRDARINRQACALQLEAEHKFQT